MLACVETSSVSFNAEKVERNIKTESTRSLSDKWTKPSTKIIYIVLQTSVRLF